MKKFFYVALAVIAIGLYSCQKESASPNKSVNGANVSMKGKRDTTPPDIAQRRLVRDTTPPDLNKR